MTFLEYVISALTIVGWAALWFGSVWLVIQAGFADWIVGTVSFLFFFGPIIATVVVVILSPPY